MPDVHPHWQSTGDDTPIPVHTRDHASGSVPIGTGSVSRLPGAFIGIILVLTVGILLSQGGEELWQDIISLPGQIGSLVQGTNGRSPFLAQVTGEVSSLSSSSEASSVASSEKAVEMPTDEAPVAEGTLPQETAAEEPTALPRNPYTVTSGITRPLDAYGAPIQNTGTSFNTLLHSGAPPSQPASGPETWVVLALSVAAMVWTTRHTLFATQEYGNTRVA
ncbi:MAG: hypothetical protein WCV62_00170 [Candidatus Peribacteraceae bacterium]|jgi:hypothetical protein